MKELEHHSPGKQTWNHFLFSTSLAQKDADLQISASNSKNCLTSYRYSILCGTIFDNLISLEVSNLRDMYQNLMQTTHQHFHFPASEISYLARYELTYLRRKLTEWARGAHSSSPLNFPPAFGIFNNSFRCPSNWRKNGTGKSIPALQAKCYPILCFHASNNPITQMDYMHNWTFTKSTSRKCFSEQCELLYRIYCWSAATNYMYSTAWLIHR